MPRVHINRKKYMIGDIGAWIVGQLHKHGKTQAELAQALEISPQLCGYRIRNNKVDYGDLLTIFQFFNTEEDIILDLMTLK